jgi:hypothetical protein
MTAPHLNIYCDESGHLEHDRVPVMVLGAVWCPAQRSREVAVRLREIRQKHGLSPWVEIKWTSVSPAKIEFFLDVVDYFFDDNDLHFRALIVPDKTKLRHEEFAQAHDDWYYKMYFDLLKLLIKPDSRYRIYLDIKDTRSAAKAAKLHDVLSNNVYDFKREVIERLQNVRSHDVQQLQLADLLTGATAYANRRLTSSDAKQRVIDRIRQRTGYSLVQSTLLREEKFNLFVWHPRGSDEP